MRKTIPSLVLIFLTTFCFAQGTFVPLNSESYTYLERLDIKYSRILPIIHTGDKPVTRSMAGKVAETLLLSNLQFNKVQKSQLQYLVDDNPEWMDSLESSTRRPLWKLYREPASFAHVNSKNKDLFNIRINPMFQFHSGMESLNSRFLFSRAAGVEVRGNIKKVFSFYFNATGNSAQLQTYVFEKTQVIGDVAGFKNIGYTSTYMPGQAYFKEYDSKVFKFKSATDYFDARGYININVLKYINISMGRDKFFIGNGYRSLFLSDYSAPYLFLKFDLNIWRFKYENIFAELTSQYFRTGDRLLPKKYMATHHLSMQVTHWLNLGIFESVIMRRSNHFELQYLNPIIFYRSVEHALGSPDNIMIGGDFKINAFNHMSIYGQVLLDEFNFSHFFKRDAWWGNKWGLQLGVKYIDIIPNLDGQIEFNAIRPYTYTHDSVINYTNYNQPLAHPLGANFYEFIFNLRYQPLPQLSFNARFISARIGDDTIRGGTFSNFGSDIIQSNGGGTNVNSSVGNKIGQGAKGRLNMFQLMTSYQPWHNLFLDAEVMYRVRSSDPNGRANPTPTSSSFIFIVGVRINVPYKSYYF